MIFFTLENILTATVLGVIGAVFATIIFALRGYGGPLPWYVFAGAFVSGFRHLGFFGSFLTVGILYLTDRYIFKNIFRFPPASSDGIKVKNFPTPDVHDDFFEEDEDDAEVDWVVARKRIIILGIVVVIGLLGIVIATK